MDRDRLAMLLADGDGDAYESCRQQLEHGADFAITDSSVPANSLEGIYARRDRHTRARGIPTLGLAETVGRLRALGGQGIALGWVKVADPPYHYILFLAQDLSAVTACTGVGQHFQQPSRRRCPECRGAAQLPGMAKTTGMGRGMGSAFGPCPTCDGVGYLTDDDRSG